MTAPDVNNIGHKFSITMDRVSQFCQFRMHSAKQVKNDNQLKAFKNTILGMIRYRSIQYSEEFQYPFFHYFHAIVCSIWRNWCHYSYHCEFNPEKNKKDEFSTMRTKRRKLIDVAHETIHQAHAKGRRIDIKTWFITQFNQFFPIFFLLSSNKRNDGTYEYNMNKICKFIFLMVPLLHSDFFIWEIPLKKHFLTQENPIK